MPENVSEMMESGMMSELMAQILEKIELAKTGHQESIDFCLEFLTMSLKQSIPMLDDPDAQAAIGRAFDREMEEHNHE
jgi:hypothetical protein